MRHRPLLNAPLAPPLTDLHRGQPHEFTEPWSDAHYSFGARQLLYRMFASMPGWKLRSSHAGASYWHDLEGSKFCLASAGWGWGGRMKVAVTHGCVPLIIQVGGAAE